MPSVSEDLMEKIISLCKRRGFVFPGSEIYGGLSNTWDFGPLGALLKNNLKRAWWKFFVTARADMVGLDTAIIMNPKAWQASGHLENFTDELVECKKCHQRFRADQLEIPASPKLLFRPRSGASQRGESKCPECGGELTAPRHFNLLLKTFLGPVEDEAGLAYLRPETAGGIFVNFKNVLATTRRRLPFGIAQIGKCFRNEITPGNFIFRTREFEIAELEYFVKPDDWEKHFERWLAEINRFWREVVGVRDDHLVWREIEPRDRAHYSKRTVDIEYHYPFGVKELHGLAYSTDFDLKNHAAASGVDLFYTDPATGAKFLPHVIEPTWGIERMLLVTMLEAYHEEEASTAEAGETETRVVLRLPKNLAPIQVAVLPLSKKPALSEVARELAGRLRLAGFSTEYDETQSIGKRYRRQDEIGTPFCVTVDFDSLADQAVTVRERDSMKQERIKIDEVEDYFEKIYK